jgi:signal recognition particle subunit SRP72
MEKIDIGQTYAEIDEAIFKEEHERVLTLSEKILKADPKEKEAFQCKMISLLNLSKNDEIIQLIEKSSLQKEYLMEYAYSLHEKKKYLESISVLNQFSAQRKEIISNINELLAQNYYKLGQFLDSYKIYKEIIETKLKASSDLEEEKDLISNFLASYVLSEVKDEALLNSVLKYLNTWESFYNYCVISLKSGNLNESMETLYRMKRDYSQQEDEFNELKNLNLNLNIVQQVLEGFDYSKVSNIVEDYDKFFHVKANNHPELVPYFYNNFLHVKKDRETINEVLRRLDNFTNLSKNELFPQEKNVLLQNKIILLLRANRIADAAELFKSLEKNFEDSNYVIIYCYIALKQEKVEKLEDIVKNDNNLRNRPESHLILIQMILSSLNSKNIEQFHFKVLNFVKQFFDFTINFHFLNFFIGFYESRHLKDYLKDFIRNYKDPNLIFKTLSGGVENTNNNEEKSKILKKCLTLLGRSFYTVGLYEESANFFSFVIENVDRYDKNTRLELINSLAHFNSIKE